MGNKHFSFWATKYYHFPFLLSSKLLLSTLLQTSRRRPEDGAVFERTGNYRSPNTR